MLRNVVETYQTDYVGEKVRFSVAGEWVESTKHHPVWVVEGEALEDRPKPDHVRQAELEIESATVPGRWVDAGDLRVGDVLLKRSGERVAIEALQLQLIVAKVYNFQVEQLHNYAVGLNGLLVHNNAPCGNERRSAVRQAWRQEQELIKAGQQGTRRWTAAEKRILAKTGKVPGYQGHHINSVNGHPELAGNPNNVEFVTRAENLARHGGNWRNPTTGELLERTIP